jgi:hypothetical protein
MQRRAIREYTSCNCAIWMTGSTDTKTYPRYAAGLRDWVAAEALKRSMEAGSFKFAASLAQLNRTGS